MFFFISYKKENHFFAISIILSQTIIKPLKGCSRSYSVKHHKSALEVFCDSSVSKNKACTYE